MNTSKIRVVEKDGRGYHSLAGFMAWQPRFAIFPRFKALNMLNLLLLQAQISRKESELRIEVSLDEAPGDDSRLELSQDIDALLGLDQDDRRLTLVRDLRKLLAEYSKLD
jgi:hypothetical protein